MLNARMTVATIEQTAKMAVTKYLEIMRFRFKGLHPDDTGHFFLGWPEISGLEIGCKMGMISGDFSPRNTVWHT